MSTSSVSAPALVVRLLIALLVALAGAAAAQGTLWVEADRERGEISPFVYGANFGPLSAITVELFPQAERAGIRFLRFPGGRWGDLNDIRPNQIDLLMRVAEMIGAEVSIHVRLENGTPEAAAELVRYTNVERGYGVRYWSIGNEPSLFDDYTVDAMNRDWRAIATAMLAVDPDIVLIGPDPHQWNGTPAVDPRDPEGRDWLRGFLEVNGDLVDIVSVHRYPFPRSQADPLTPVDDLRANSAEWGEILPRLRAVVRETTGRDLPLAVTEANSHWSANIGTETSTDSLFNALWWADALGRLIDDGAVIVNYFDLQSSDSRGGWGLMARYAVRPSYYVYQLYQRLGTTLLASGSDAEHVSTVAARRDDGAVTMLIVNLNDGRRTLGLLGLGGRTPSEVRLLDRDHGADTVPPTTLIRGDLLTLPGRSAALLVFE